MSFKAKKIAVLGAGLSGVLVAKKLFQNGHEVSIIDPGIFLTSEKKKEIWNLESFSRSKLSAIDIDVQKNVRHRYQKKLPLAIGGLAEFYQAVSIPFHEKEFSSWPISKSDLDPFYKQAQEWMNIKPSHEHGNISPLAKKLYHAGKELHKDPYYHPIAIDFSTCRHCSICNQVPCPWDARFSPSLLLQELQTQGIRVLDRSLVTAATMKQGKILNIKVTNLENQKESTIDTDEVIVCAGALNTPFIIKNIFSCDFNHIGKNLMLHLLGNVIGFFPKPITSKDHFEKWVSFSSDYFDSNGKVRGIIQQDQMTGPQRILEYIPGTFPKSLFTKIYDQLTQLLVIVDDESCFENQVYEKNGKICVQYQDQKKDLEKRAFLLKQAKKIIKKSGALATITTHGKSIFHACGTCRMGVNSLDSVVNFEGRVHDRDNLWIADASTFNSSGGVNPSLTIAANALRIADRI
ncbi:MAG: GMC family oxidoreductase [Bdellovibrionales bacterium]|nr:GMC family oxidoreductase [Bdellovibrionales bacterium]